MSIRGMFDARGESGCTPHPPPGRLVSRGRYFAPHGNGELLVVTLWHAPETDEFFETLVYSQPRSKRRPEP